MKTSIEPGKIKLVRATLKDAVCIHEMKYKAFLPLYEKYHDDETNPAKEAIDKTIRLLQQKATDYLLIEWEDKRVGAVRVQDKGNEIYRISPIFILPEFQNKGIAQGVFKVLFASYPDAKVWRLDTILQEKGNCHLYEKMGFVRTGKEEKINDQMTLIDYEKINR